MTTKKKIKRKKMTIKEKIEKEITLGKLIIDKQLALDKYRKEKSREVYGPAIDPYSIIAQKYNIKISYTPQELWLKFTQRIEFCKENHLPYITSGFCVYARISTTKLLKLEERREEFHEVLQDMHEFLKLALESKIATEKGNWEFIATNRFGGEFKNKFDVDNKHSVSKDIKSLLDEITKRGN